MSDEAAGDVSRETSPSELDPGDSPAAPPTPTSARGVFSLDTIGSAERYAALLATDGVVRGLIGPREVTRLWDRHLLNSALLTEVLPEHASVCDIGSGAGLPGLVVAIARPDLAVTLVEPLLRRTTFLSEVVSELGLSNVEVVRGRADALHGSRTFDVVTSRAVAPLGRLLEWSMPLVSPDGALVAMKGSSVVDEIKESRRELARFRCAEPEVLQLGDGIACPQTWVVRVAWADPSRVGLPNSSVRSSRPGRSAKRGASSSGKKFRRS